MRSHAQDGAGFPSNQHYFHFLFILNEPLRAPWFCFLEEVEQHSTRTGAACPADTSAAVLTGRHPTPSPGRGTTWWPTNLPGMHHGDAMRSHGWAATVPCLTGPPWHHPPRHATAVPSWGGRCRLGERPRAAAGQAEAQPPVRGPARWGAPSPHGVSLRVQWRRPHNTWGAGHPSSPLLLPTPECPQAIAFIN